LRTRSSASSGIRFWGGYAFLEQPQTNGVAEVREAVDTFVDLYSDRWLPEKNGFISPSATREAWYAR